MGSIRADNELFVTKQTWKVQYDLCSNVGTNCVQKGDCVLCWLADNKAGTGRVSEVTQPVNLLHVQGMSRHSRIFLCSLRFGTVMGDTSGK